MKKITLFLALIALSIFLQAQTIDGWFPFEISALDTFEVEFAPKFPLDPIEENDFVSINSDGHFEVNGNPIRFWGTPSYPLKEEWILPQDEVKTLARELRKMGVNIIRVHSMDSHGENTIFGAQTTTRTLNPVQLDKMDYYIAEFKKQGIYIMMDMLTNRQYTKEDGVYDPDSVYDAAKEVNFFDPYLIQLQKEYAAQLLTHVNPYTGKALKDDPVLALIDIVNEGWFLHSVRCDQIKLPSEGGRMSQYHYNMLTGLWNDFLLDKYGTQQAMMKSWGIWPTSDVEVDNLGFESNFEGWDYGFYGAVKTTLEISGEAHSGEKSFHINTTETDGLGWECYANNDFPVEEGSIYTVSFWAKSENANIVSLAIARSNDREFIAGGDFTVSGDWKQYKLSFKMISGDDHAVMLINMGAVKGNFWLDDVTVIKGEEELHDGGSLENHDIKLLRITQNNSEIIKQRKIDQSEFYIKIQTDYFTEMYNFLKDEIGIQIPVTGSNYLVGIPDFYIQNYTDFVDNHGYWTYDEEFYPASMIGSPQFSNPMINLFAGTRVKGKPLTASEYNYDLYNPCANEALFFLSTYGSFHKADMLMIHGYDYGPLPGGVFRSSLDNYHRLYDKAMLPGFAYVYRNGLIAPAEETVNINFTRDNVNNLIFRDDEMWGTNAYPNDYPFELIYQHDVQTDFTSGIPYNVSDYPARPSSPYRSDTDEIEWDSTGIFSVNAPKFCAFVGQLDQFAGKSIGPIQIVNTDKRCGVTLLSLDEKNIDESQKMLLTITTQQKHDEWQFNGYHDLNGHAPLMLEAATVSFNLRNEANTIRVNWLDKHGNPSGYYEVFEKNGDGVIPITINTYDHNGIWFGIEATKPVPQIDLVEFLSGEYPIINEKSTLQWYSNMVENIDFYWSDDEGATLHEIEKSVVAGNNSLSWVPVSINSDSCSIIAISGSNPSVSDTITFPIRKFSDDNLIKNGSFTSGMNYWSFYPDPSNDVTYSTLNNEFNVQVNVQPDEVWHYSLSQYEIYLEEGHYLLDLDFTLPEPGYTYAYFTFSDQNTWENIIEDDIIMYRWESNKHFRFEFNYSGNKTIPLRFSINLGGVESSAFIDNIVLKKETKIDIVQNLEITFQVDLQNETVSPNGVHLMGSWDNWATAVKLDNTSEKIYSATMTLTPGNRIDYKFINGNPTGNTDDYIWENFNGSCTDEWTNRFFIVPDESTILDPVCFNSCEMCEPVVVSDSVSVTFRVDMQNETVSDKGVHIGGSFESFGVLDANGSVYSATIKLKKGETLSYKFINGELYDWAKYETITGNCTSGDAGDRWLLVPNNDVTLDVVCFGSCGECEPVVVSDSVNVTFRVDMQNETVSATGVNINGSFSNWAEAKPMQLFSGGIVYAATLRLKKGETIEYKFVNGGTTEWDKYEILTGQPCAFGNDANRGFVVPINDAMLDVVCFGKCDECAPDNLVDIPFKNLMVYPNPTKGEVVITGLPNSEQKTLNITNINGSVLQTIEVAGVSASVDLSTLKKGIYFLKISDRTSQRIFKVVKN